MDIQKKIKKLQKEIELIKVEINALGDIHPGSISTQYNVCGNPTCACKNKKNPKKHGPYYQLSYSYQRKSTTRFIKEEHIENIKQQVENYKTLKKLTNKWIGISIEVANLHKKIST